MLNGQIWLWLLCSGHYESYAVYYRFSSTGLHNLQSAWIWHCWALWKFCSMKLKWVISKGNLFCWLLECITLIGIIIWFYVSNIRYVMISLKYFTWIYLELVSYWLSCYCTSIQELKLLYICSNRILCCTIELYNILFAVSFTLTGSEWAELEVKNFSVEPSNPSCRDVTAFENSVIRPV